MAVNNLKVKDLTLRVGSKVILKSISLEFEPSRWVSVIGPNGAGKTSLVEAISGVGMAPKETVFIGERDLTTFSERERATLVSFVPQNPVIPRGLSVFDYLCLGRTAYQGAWRSAGPEDKRITEDVAGRLGVSSLFERELASLSGGERQRVVLGRSLVQQCPILVLDEPTAALDIRHQLETLRLLRQEVAQQGICVVSTLHDLTLAGQFADRLVVLDDGQVAIDGPAHEVIRNPKLSSIYGLRLEVVTVDGSEIVVPAPR